MKEERKLVITDGSDIGDRAAGKEHGGKADLLKLQAWWEDSCSEC